MERADLRVDREGADLLVLLLALVAQRPDGALVLGVPSVDDAVGLDVDLGPHLGRRREGGGLHERVAQEVVVIVVGREVVDVRPGDVGAERLLGEA